MAESVTVDELHVTITIPASLPADRAEGVRQALAADEFLVALSQAVDSVIRMTPALSGVRFALSR